MATKVRRVTDFARHGMNYLLYRDQVSPLEKKRNTEKEWLKKHIDENGELDAKGNRNIYFSRDGSTRFVPGPGTTEYWGLQQRRTPGAEYMDTEEVKKFVDTLPAEVQTRVVYDVTTTIVDTEELYVLQQEGHISKAQLRKLIHQRPDSFQLWPITDEPIEEDDDE